MSNHKRRLLWVSRHAPTIRQRAELRRLFGPHSLIISPSPFEGADSIVARMHQHSCDDLILVAPFTVVRALCERNIRPIWAEMREVPLGSPRADCTNNGRAYRFIRFLRITSVSIHTEPIQPFKADASPSQIRTDKENA